MITIEPLTAEWQQAFLESRNSLFTPVSTASWQNINRPTSDFPVRTFICRDESRVLSWASFYLRQVELGSAAKKPLIFAQAWAIGTLPNSQRKGYGRKVWSTAERELARETDGILIYTNEDGDGYAFYRAMGYLPLVYPNWLRLKKTQPLTRSSATHDNVRTSPFTGFENLGYGINDLFLRSYRGYAGFLANRPRALDSWANASPFYDHTAMQFTPQISWLKDANGHPKGYAIWAGPMHKPTWKHGAVEILEIACTEDCDQESLRTLLQPALNACQPDTPFDWWAPAEHSLIPKMLALGFEELPRNLCVLGTVFNPATQLMNQLQAASLDAPFTVVEQVARQRIDLKIGDACVEIERDAAVRLIFGRSNASIEHALGLLTVRPIQVTARCLQLLDVALPCAPWAYFPSEYI